MYADLSILPAHSESSLAEAPALDSDIAHEYSDHKIPTFRDQMSLADFIQFKFLIYFSFESFSTELSQIFLAGCIQGLQYSWE